MDYNINAKRETPVSQNSGQPANTEQPSKTAASSDVGSLFATADKNAKDRTRANKAAYSSLSALKIVSNVVGGLIYHSEGMSEDEIEQRSNEVLQHYAQQSKSLHAKLGLPDERFVYESITGALSRLISQHYRAVGPDSLNVDWSNILSSVNDLDGVWEEAHVNDKGNTSTRRSMAMMNALSPVVSAYQRFNFFHDDSNEVLQRLGDLIWKTVDDALNENPIAKSMDESELEMLRSNLLLRAGDLMSDAWLSNAKPAMAQLREMPAEERRNAMANGLPLTEVEQKYTSQFQLIRQTLDISLSVHASNMPDEELSDSALTSPSH